MPSIAMSDGEASNVKKLKVSNSLGDSRKERTARLQLVLPESSYDRLDALKEATEAASYAEVIRRALRIYEGIIAEAHDGSEFVVRRPNGEEEIILSKLLF